MHKPNIKAAYNAVKKSTIKHSPEILTGIGIAGMVTTTVMAVRATPKALKLIGSAELKKANETNIPYEGHNLSKTEIIKVTWKCYVPVAITGGLSIACLIGASSVNARRNAALATAYSIAETSLKEYQNKVVETIGEKKSRLSEMPLQKRKSIRIRQKKAKLYLLEMAKLFATMYYPDDISSQKLTGLRKQRTT